MREQWTLSAKAGGSTFKWYFIFHALGFIGASSILWYTNGHCVADVVNVPQTVSLSVIFSSSGISLYLVAVVNCSNPSPWRIRTHDHPAGRITF